MVSRLENNFGDLLGPMVVDAMVVRAGRPTGSRPTRRLLAVGSILHAARDGDVVWGSGRNGRIPEAAYREVDLDVRAVRGPLTREWLLGRGVHCPEVFGDPAQLLPMLRPDLVQASMHKRWPVTYVRHVDDLPKVSSLFARGVHIISARDDIERVLRTIVQSELVVSTSLHAVVVAEAFGVPARSIRMRTEHECKFADYYLATGRQQYSRVSSVGAAISAGPEVAPVWDPTPLLDAFPLDLFPPAPPA